MWLQFLNFIEYPLSIIPVKLIRLQFCIANTVICSCVDEQSLHVYSAFLHSRLEPQLIPSNLCLDHKSPEMITTSTT